VDAFKVDRQKPSRLSWMGMDGMEAETVRDVLKDTTNRYQDLKSRCNMFGDKTTGLATKQRDFNDNTYKLLSWLTGMEEKLSAFRQEPTTTEPEALNDQLERMKGLGTDAIAHRVRLDDLGKLGKTLGGSMQDLSVNPTHVQKIEKIVDDISGRHDAVSAEINDRANVFQTALTKSQDVQAAIDNLLVWLRDTYSSLSGQRPISLSLENLNEQLQELQVLEADIESHKPSIESVKSEANELIKMCDLDMAKSLEAKLSDLNNNFGNVQRKCRARAKDLDSVSTKLGGFMDKLEECKEWLVSSVQTLESPDWKKKSESDAKETVDKLLKEKRRKLADMEDMKSQAQQLVNDPRTGETATIKDVLGGLERNWSDLDAVLSGRDKEITMKAQQGNEYEALKKLVDEWLTVKEGKVDGFQPVAVDVEVVGRQIEELQVISHYKLINLLNN
jgi:dystonin